MPGAMRKLGLYLGLVEDDEDNRHGGYDDDHYYDETPEPAPTRAYRTDLAPRPSGRPPFDTTQTRGSMALDSAPAPQHRPHVAAVPEDPYRITTLTPRTYNEARTIGEHFREGTPVIMNLTEMDDTDAKRLVDFAAGLIFGLRGSIERVTNKVFLLSPEHVEVTAEDKALIVEGGFFNQS
jgi:cell division inhibitor SepF